jgi:hypothetical protein
MDNETHPLFAADHYQLDYGVFGVTLTFMKRRHRSDSFPVPSPLKEGDQIPPTKNEAWSEDQASIFMNAEHAKAMVYMMHRQICQTEAQIGKTDLPQSILERSKITAEDWTLFWSAYDIVDENQPEGDTDGDAGDPEKASDGAQPGSSGADGQDGSGSD